jgi:hypothetical protein
MAKPFGITCMSPGCTNKIRYGPNEDVPLYCICHRTEDGKHSEIRKFKTPKKPMSVMEAMKQVTVIYRCTNRNCHHKTTIPFVDWMEGKPITCSECGRPMLYHKDVEPCLK